MLKKLVLFIVLFFATYNYSFASYIYFYGQGCSHCAKVASFMEANDIVEKYDVEKKEVYYDDSNRELFLDYANKLWIASADLWVPFLLSEDDNKYYMWDDDIINLFKWKMGSTINVEWEESSKPVQEKKSFWWFFAILLPAALADSINPCVFAVMLILLGSILNRFNSYKKMIFSGLLFALAIFISYYLMWLGIYKALSHATSIYYMKMWVWILWLVVWIANLKDFFWYGKWFVMEVPLSWRPKLKSVLDKATSPMWAFFIWFIVSLFLLPCTSGPYFTILGYLASESNSINMLGYFYLFVYNLVFILPMLVIILLVSVWAKTVGELKDYKEFYIREIHLVVAILMFLLSGYIFYDLFY